MPASGPPTSAAQATRAAHATQGFAPSHGSSEEHLNEIERSHSRSKAFGLSRIEKPDFSPVGRADLTAALDRNRRLHSHAAPIMEMLYDQIVNTQSMVVLCDAVGTVIHSIGDDDFLARATKVALAPGANWSESAKGTNAVGTALVSEAPTLVHADEHYLHANHFLTCSAAPILDPRGNILGVLDVSGDHRSYHQHTMALVKMSARMIENHWLADDYHHAMRLHFHARVGFLGTLMEGILAVAPDGRFVGANRSALEQLNLSGAALRMHRLESLFGLSVGALVDRFRSPLATPVVVTSHAGQTFHLMARFNWPVWSQVTDAAAASVPPAAEATTPAVNTPSSKASSQGLGYLLTGDPQVSALVERVRRVMDRAIPILILGESGTGKTLLASAIHADSSRADKPFVAVNCAALSEASLEAELFAPQEAGAVRRKSGSARIAQAEGGTLFLEEIGEMPLAVQARLLSVLQRRRVATEASASAQCLELNIVCSSSKPLGELVRAKAFREDLYYRINGLTVRLPALRERTDCAALTRRLLPGESSSNPWRLGPEVQALFEAYPWPGNIRQLSNVLRTAALMAGSDRQITAAHLPDDFIEEARGHGAVAADPAMPPATAGVPTGAEITHALQPTPQTLPESPPSEASLDELQRVAIQRAVDAAKGNISEAAKKLGVSRNTIYRKLRWNQSDSA